MRTVRKGKCSAQPHRNDRIEYEYKTDRTATHGQRHAFCSQDTEHHDWPKATREPWRPGSPLSMSKPMALIPRGQCDPDRRRARRCHRTDEFCGWPTTRSRGPGRQIPAKIKLTGIDNPPCGRVKQDALTEFICQADAVLAHNADFGYSVLPT